MTDNSYLKYKNKYLQLKFRNLLEYQSGGMNSRVNRKGPTLKSPVSDTPKLPDIPLQGMTLALQGTALQDATL